MPQSSLAELANFNGEIGWFDLWHTHADWHGEGNQGPEERQKYFSQLFAIWKAVEGVSLQLVQPSQVWVVIDGADSNQDAVYLHTPNPNRDNFPLPV